MNKYSYRALTADGKEKKGKLIAENPNILINQLKEKGLSVYSYNIVGKQVGELSKFSKLNSKDLIAFSTQLSQMLVAGLPLGQSLQMLYERTEAKKKNLKKTFAFLFEQVQKGNSLSDAMEMMGQAFPQLYVSMIRSGQLSGKIDETLVNLANHFTKQQKQRNLIKSAMMYPIILITVAFGVVILLTTSVLPKMVANLPSAKDIPPITKILLNFKDFIIKYWYIVILIIFSLVMLKKVFGQNDKFKTFTGKMLVKAPKIGRLNKMVYTAQFASTLSTLYSVGVNLLDAVQMTGEVVTNRYVSKQVMNSTTEIKKGSTISDAFATIESFDPLLTTMIFVGEQSGSLSDILKKTADYFDEEATLAIKQLTSLLQPVMLIIVAVMVGFVLIGVMSPMFAIYKSIGG